MKNVNATQARKEIFNLIKNAIKKHKVFHIHHRNGNVVLLSEKEYENVQVTLELLASPGFRESIRKSLRQIEKGEAHPLYELFGAKN